MRFWETSAIVPLLVDEPSTIPVRKVLRDDPQMIVWWATSLECLSALARVEREGSLVPDAADRARDLLSDLRGAWAEVLATEAVRQRASLLLLRHPLRAADALQLAAALTWAEGRAGSDFCTLDDRLAVAARGEGFALVL